MGALPPIVVAALQRHYCRPLSRTELLLAERVGVWLTENPHPSVEYFQLIRACLAYDKTNPNGDLSVAAIVVAVLAAASR
jgi:hypothetical protein